MARRLLTNILSEDPSKRFQSMEEILVDDYFVSANVVEHWDNWNKKVVEAIQQNTVELRNTKKEIIEKIESSTSVTLTDIFETTKVNNPTCFVILPYKIPVQGRDSGDETGEADAKVDKALKYIEYVLDTVTKCIASPVDFAAEFVESKFFESPMYLYLIDEWTEEPVVCVDGVYPVEIPVQAEQAKKFLPLMALGMQALALTNKAARIVSMLYPVVPSKVIPQTLLDKAKTFFAHSNKCGVIEEMKKEAIQKRKQEGYTL